MGLIKMAALGALGYAGYKYYENSKSEGNAAFASGQTSEGNFTQVRSAGPGAMADAPVREWTKADEMSDESFPASDPPSTY
ncbi:hypothetical protein [Altericroceibacterium xinjiangense]|uniref:hypothetical protein n=1 Tax=Altericroceibacterium xinjiangense TaxID=762261 RepID=UPI000F7D94F3|nr:hypothetical protein [Altericroceibacterium xinjiangense]